MLTVFYDGKCGLCRREIAYYQRVAPKEAFTWIDITKDSNAFKQLGFTVKAGLLVLHVQKNDGTVSKGLDAFILIWNDIPRFKILSFLLSLPIIYPLTKLLYQGFAHWRFKRMGYDKCDI